MKCIVFHADLINSKEKKYDINSMNKQIYEELYINYNLFSAPKIILGDMFQFILEMKYINDIYSIIRTIKKIFNNDVRLSVTAGVMNNKIEKDNNSIIYSHELPNEELFYKSSIQFKEIDKKRRNYNGDLKTNVNLSITDDKVLNDHFNSVYLAIENITNKWKKEHYDICLLLSNGLTYKKIIDNFSSSIKYESQLSRTVSNKSIRLVLNLENSCLDILKEGLK